MIAQIQTYFSHFFGKLVALALFLFIFTSFNLQILTANAQGTTTPAKTTSPAPDTKSTGTSTNLTDKQVNDRIGTLKNCSIDGKSEDYQKKLKEDPTEANNFIYKCLKDIVQIVVTISAILAVMRLIFIGIKFLNTFDDGAKLNTELSNAITGFIAGAVILGLFVAIINVVNPSALRTDKIFSAQVIADYKCLNKGISDKNAATVDKNKCTDSNKDKPGPSTSNQTFTGESIQTILKSTKPEDEAGKIVAQSKLDTCLAQLGYDSGQKSECSPFLQAFEADPSLASKPDQVTMQPNYKIDLFANGTYKITGNEGGKVTADYFKVGSKKPIKVVLSYAENKECIKTPFKESEKYKVGNELKSGEQLNYAPCTLTISK